MKTKKLPMVFSFAGILLCILDTDTVLTACREGIELCLYTVLPSLFPFCVFSILLSRNIQTFPLLRLLGQIFRLPKGQEPILLTGFLGGYPIGAQTVHAAWTAGKLTREDANRMLMFSSQPGPAFLFGILGNTFSTKQCWLLWGILLFSAWISAQILPEITQRPDLPCKHATGTLKPVVSAAVAAMGNICGWILLMRIAISFLDKWILYMLPDYLRCLVSGILELTNGCCMISSVTGPRIRFILACCTLSFGGICVLMQTKSLTSGLDIRFYLVGKLIQTLSCLCITGALCGCIPLLVPFLPVIWWIFSWKKQKTVAFPLDMVYNPNIPRKRDDCHAVSQKN